MATDGPSGPEGRERPDPDPFPVALVTLDPDGNVTFVNRFLVEEFGWEETEILGRPVTDLLTEAAGVFFANYVVPVVRSRGRIEETQLAVLTPDGSVVPVVVAARTDGTRGLWMSLSTSWRRDAVEAELAAVREELATLRSVATIDELTGLANRRELRRRAETMLADARRHGLRTGLLVIDLDRFKRINDEFGHIAGDVVLRSVGARLTAHVRASDVVARIGGEEFVVLLADVEPDEAVERAEAIRVLLGQIPAGDSHLSASVGVTTAVGDDVTLDAMFAAADLALYRAKDAGRDRTDYEPQS